MAVSLLLAPAIKGQSMVKQIPLGGKKGAGKFALVDDDMFDLLSKYSWSLSSGGYATGGTRAQRELGHYFMHRVVNQTPKGAITDHIDRDRLNNQRANLRNVTGRQNMMNTSIRAGKSSKYKGVWWNPIAHLWTCAISVNDKYISLGYYRTQRDAAIAYNNAALLHFGEYASLNNISEYDPDDLPIMKRRPKKKSALSFVGVTPNHGSYIAFIGQKYLGCFPDMRFAAKVYDAAAIIRFGSDAICHVNFPELVKSPIDLNARYVFRAKSKSNLFYSGVSRIKNRTSWISFIFINGKKVSRSFSDPIQAAEHYDKLVLIHRDNICTLINFPDKLQQYLAEIGDQIISPKPIVIPDLT